MTVAEYFDHLENPVQHQLMSETHHLILELIPTISVNIKWRIPFYTYLAPLCYLNPHKDHCYIGFVRGRELSNEQGLLTGTDRKLIRILEIKSLEDLYQDAVAEIILEAAALVEKDGMGWKISKKNSKKS